MLFNSYEFIFGYLPITFAVFFLLAFWRHRVAAAWLAVSSLFFYGWWNPTYVLLLVGSILCNFWFALQISRSQIAGNISRSRQVLTVAICTNLGLLGYYKYAGFFLTNVGSLTGGVPIHLDIVLPLGISFFTFTQIAFLVDTHQGKASEYSLVHYFLFVTYFPHLIAGPVLHHKEMMPQFAEARTYRVHAESIAVGLTIFLIGLFKKTVLADGIAPNVGPVFSAGLRGETISFFDAWGGALAYTLQLYFDFSGYSDMAIGLSRMFGIRLPLNFHSPYKAVNIIDFWRRWHMTLSRFLRDYLYVPLGGNRRGTVRRFANLAITMVLGGLWHGAGWTFVIWGALHGAYLMVNHAWIAMRSRLGRSSERSWWGKGIARLVTLIAVIVGWVFFRAESVDAALAVLRGMTGINGISLPGAIISALGPIGAMLQSWGVVLSLGGGARFLTMYLWIIALMIVVLFAPNTQEVLRKFRPALGLDGSIDIRTEPSQVAWNPSHRWAIGIGLLGACGLLSLSRVSEFLYFQF